MSDSSEPTLKYTQERVDLPGQEDLNKGPIEENTQDEDLVQAQQLIETQQIHKGAEIGDSIPPDLRRGQRTRVLSKKGKQLQDVKLNDLERAFERMYKRWKYDINGLKRSIKHKEDPEFITEIVNAINAHQADVSAIYDRIRAISVPDLEIRRKIDSCYAITKTAREKAQCFITVAGDPEDIPWPEADSVFDPTESSVVSVQSFPASKSSSWISLESAQKRQQAAAEVAATQEVFKIMKSQHQCEEEIRELEAEEKKVIAEREVQEKAMEVERAKQRALFVAESIERKRKLEEKRKEVERLEELKKHNAAQARLQVYAEEDQQDPPASTFQGRLGTHVIAGSMSGPVIPPLVSLQGKAPVSRSSFTLPQGYSVEAVVPQVNSQTTSHEATNNLVKMLAEAITANRIPIPEPSVFFGDPLQYTDWKVSFQTLTDRKNLSAQEKLYFLRKYVGGVAKRAIEGYSLVKTEEAYCAAWDILDDRFGNSFIVGKAYRDKIHSWHKISSKDNEDLREFADFLTSVTAAMPYVQGLQTLNDCVEIQRIVAKLPDWLSSRWNRTATVFQDEHNAFPDFKSFVQFLNKEARIVCNPITSLQALKSIEQENSRQSDLDHKLHRNRNSTAKTFTTNSSEKTNPVCVFCKRHGHFLHKCRKFMEKPVEERVKFVYSEKLCFGCLKIGHSSKHCISRSVCEKCGKHHPTCLHQDWGEKPICEGRQMQSTVSQGSAESKCEQPNDYLETSLAISNRVIQYDRNTHTSSILPVYVSSATNPEEETLVYALLDTQSDTTFILKDIADLLPVKQDPVRLNISTITSKTMVVSSNKLYGLQVRGLRSEERINLPVTYTREYIPANKSDIPTCKSAKSWPHLEHLADEMAPELDCEVGLLIGYNCSQVLLPRNVVSGKEGEPFAQKSVLGWSIIGYSNPDNGFADEIGISHRIISKEVLPATQTPQPIKSEVHFVYQTKVKEMFTPADMLKIFELDFTAKELIDSNWFTRPSFLWQRELPKDEVKAEESDSDPELRRAQVLTTKVTEQNVFVESLQNFSDGERMVKAIARLKCWARKVKGRKERSESTRLKERKEVKSNQPFRLHRLRPFVDEHNILRVGGRLTKWKKEYLLNLQQRSKWSKNHRETKVNDVVCLQDDLDPRNRWKLAKVVEVFPGSDGWVRKVKVLVSDATLDCKGACTIKSVYLERPVHKTIFLFEPD
ncbi:uncharacterized protein [Misgurnus anguillicaudatus]|uniref:uncharacterized protein n=1 Tax=Misgurnus anguillicaudatus TaxID=75329 RepID=UPI003CCF6AF8